jgi:hypothetical protein
MDSLCPQCNQFNDECTCPPSEVRPLVALKGTVVDGMKTLDKFVNNLALDEKNVGKFAGEYFITMHRTLQQSLIRVLYYTLQRIATYHNEHPGQYDDRNEASVKWIQDTAKNMTAFPFI